ncbi:hypothetical protein HYQ44_013527 [Verticillium longisporum]|nr:hypothetical protein HYQ44_013527 [Verticillium longisporum]
MADRQQRALPASRPANDSNRRPAPVSLPASRLRNNHVPEPQPPERMRLESRLLGREPVQPPKQKGQEKRRDAAPSRHKRRAFPPLWIVRAQHLEAAVERALRRRQRPQLRGRGSGALLGRQHAVEEARAAGPRQETEYARDLANVGANVEGQGEVVQGSHRMGATGSMSGAAQ